MRLQNKAATSVPRGASAKPLYLSSPRWHECRHLPGGRATRWKARDARMLRKSYGRPSLVECDVESAGRSLSGVRVH
jgi:hypothetical protein